MCELIFTNTCQVVYIVWKVLKELVSTWKRCKRGHITLCFLCYKPTLHFVLFTQQKANPNSSSLSGERITRLFELGVEPERRSWVERYLNFMEERGTPVAHLPAVGKKPLDLWKLYIAVREIGGLAMVKCTHTVGYLMFSSKVYWRNVS